MSFDFASVPLGPLSDDCGSHKLINALKRPPLPISRALHYLKGSSLYLKATKDSADPTFQPAHFADGEGDPQGWWFGQGHRVHGGGAGGSQSWGLVSLTPLAVLPLLPTGGLPKPLGKQTHLQQ